MAAAFPMPLRARFQEDVEEGLSGRAAAARLKLSAATGVRWLRRFHERGGVAPETRLHVQKKSRVATERLAFIDETSVKTNLTR